MKTINEGTRIFILFMGLQFISASIWLHGTNWYWDVDLSPLVYELWMMSVYNIDGMYHPIALLYVSIIFILSMILAAITAD